MFLATIHPCSLLPSLFLIHSGDSNSCLQLNSKILNKCLLPAVFWIAHKCSTGNHHFPHKTCPIYCIFKLWWLHYCSLSYSWLETLEVFQPCLSAIQSIVLLILHWDVWNSSLPHHSYWYCFDQVFIISFLNYCCKSLLIILRNSTHTTLKTTFHSLTEPLPSPTNTPQICTAALRMADVLTQV